MEVFTIEMIPAVLAATIHDVKASFSFEGYLATLLADILSLDGTLYHVRMGLQLPGYVPDPIDTVELDYGRVAVVDYTKGMGTIGLGGVLPGKSQIRLYLNTTKLEGDVMAFEQQQLQKRGIPRQIYPRYRVTNFRHTKEQLTHSRLSQG